MTLQVHTEAVVEMLLYIHILMSAPLLKQHSLTYIESFQSAFCFDRKDRYRTIVQW